MHGKWMFVLLILSGGLLSAQSVQTTGAHVPTRLHGIPDDGEVVGQIVPAQAMELNHANSAQLQFTFSTFQFPGVNRTIAFGINNQGQVVGGYRILPDVRHAALFENDQLFPLAPSSVLGSHFSEALDINDRGDIVGTYFDEQGNQHGFLLSNNVLTNIDFPDSVASMAFAINASGVIVGAFTDAADALHGFVLRDGVFTQIDVPGAGATEADKINDAGDIVGSWGADINEGHGFLLTREGNFISIDAPKAQPASTSVFGINDRGQIVGGYGDADGNLHCFLLVAGTFTDVDFPGAPFTQCVGISNKGIIAGGAFDGNGGVTGYVATPTHR
jgi:probable HAF family extracellular repeat protein